MTSSVDKIVNLDFCGPVNIPFTHFEERWLEIPVFQLFTKIVNQYPDKLALKDNQTALTYQEVYQLALAIVCETKPYVSKGEPIGIALKNNVYFPVAMLASLALGCPYVALDINLPIARNELTIQHSGLKTIISVADINLFSPSFHYVCIDQLEIKENEPFVASATPDDIAYIIYTSGSTGTPKGVFQNQRNLLHDVMQYTNSIHLSDKDRLSLFYSPSVGGAIRDIYGALLNGATLSIKNLKETGLYDLEEFIRKEQITIYHSIPNIFRTFLHLNSAEKSLSSVRIIYLAGDRIFSTDVVSYQKFFSENCLLYVGIGSTEVATIYRQWFINHSMTIHQELIPLGYPVPDKAMVLVNENNELSEEGEIIISSKYISLGYWRDTEQTEKSFSVEGDLRIFKTGDLGRLNATGSLEFLGRKDNQVKINGYRVELNEIEGALMSHNAVIRCAVILVRADTLMAFFMSERILDETILKNWLSNNLPAYMIPGRCIQLQNIPLLHNFKNDYATIRQLAQQYTFEEGRNIEKNSGKPELFEILRETWGTFLDRASFDKNIAWKNAGGNSLNAVNFLVQLEINLGVTLPTDWIHGGMQPDEVYQYLRHLPVLSKSRTNKIIYYFPPIVGISPEARDFLNEISHYVNVKIINYPDFTNLPIDKSGWDKIHAFIAGQLANETTKDIGLLSSCSGGIMINNFITNTPANEYWLIGLIDGGLYHEKVPLNVSFIERVLLFFKVGKLGTRVFNYLYRRVSVFQRTVNFLYKHKLIQLDKQNIVSYIFQQYQPGYTDREVIYFKSENKISIQVDTEKTRFYKNIEIVPLKGEHKDLLDKTNAQIIRNKIFEKLS